ncbi:branched-chain amino acid transporter permease [Lactobacillus sp. Sy-1]|uniref:branched-chain amino acid transporter permease n=1 Tax=Lactobacillus sp. Sy-1 TaxID=2109645 RepID=UPI001C5AD267|nr:branched-chain amino acid transporter permease [Lactobacillus sp. Sy-1]MBW1606397.1 AzlD domain-containing protein [Lactobacillus sp. Sy-1]
MTLTEQIITIAIASVTTMATRFVPFFVFPEHKPTPRFVKYLGDYLPPAILGILVVYCYKDQILTINRETLWGIIAGTITLGIHFWKQNMMLSILAGTASYILLLNFVHF